MVLRSTMWRMCLECRAIWLLCIGDAMTRARAMVLCCVVAACCLANCSQQRPSTAPATDVFVAQLLTLGEMVTVGDPVNITDRPGYDNQPSFTLDGR